MEYKVGVLPKPALNALEMWCYRSKLRVSYVQQKNNVTILERLGKDKEIDTIMKKQKTGFLWSYYAQRLI